MNKLPLLCCLLVGCAQTKHNPVPPRYRFATSDAKTGYLAEQAQPNQQVELLESVPMQGSRTATREPETVKAYAVRRYVDPVNQRILHERGVVYRVERDSAWNVEGYPSNQVVLGPTVGPKDRHRRTYPAAQELASELAKQRRVTQELRGALEEHTAPASSDDLSKLVRSTANIAQDQAKLLVGMRALDERTLDLHKRIAAVEAAEKNAATDEPPKQAATPPSVPLPKDNGLQAPSKSTVYRR